MALNLIRPDVFGTWTPVLTFATPGDLNVVYSVQTGTYIKIGRLVTVHFNIQTSTFTHTTAVGVFSITGLPFASGASAPIAIGSLSWQGITAANHTHFYPRMLAGQTSFGINGSGSGQNLSGVSPGEMPSGGTVFLRGHIAYVTD